MNKPFINKIEWGFMNYGESIIHEVQIYSIQNDPDNHHYNPLKVEGRLIIENPIKEEEIPFIYFHKELSIDLSMFPYTKPQIELIKEHLMELCQSSKVVSGNEHIFISPLKHLYTIIFYSACGIGLGIIIKSCS